MDRVSASSGDVSNVEVDRVTGQSSSFKHVFAAAALGIGGVATVGWIVLLGWAVTQTLAANAPKIKAALPASQHAAVGAPEKPGKGYTQPSSPIETPPKHP